MNEASRVDEADAQRLRTLPPALQKSVWIGGAELLRVVNVVDEAPEVKTFVLQAETPALFNYNAGQFLTLDLPAPSGPLLRTYTISSAPSRPMTISVTVKAQAASVGTRWMFENLKLGSLIRAMGPAGHFTLELARRKKLLFISAGSGITPMMSMLRWLADVSPGSEVAFLHCARSPDDIIFRDELKLTARSMQNLELGFIVEQRDQANAWEGLVGRLDLGKIESLVPDFCEREVYCCGPDPFMKWVRQLVLSHGVPESHYHEEAFTFSSMPVVGAAATMEIPAQSDEPDAPSNMVQFQVSGTECACEPGQTLLQTARRANVRILSVCEMGLCGTCKVMKLSGNVAMEHNGGITDEEIQEGYVLACCSKPTSTVVIEA